MVYQGIKGVSLSCLTRFVRLFPLVADAIPSIAIPQQQHLNKKKRGRKSKQALTTNIRPKLIHILPVPVPRHLNHLPRERERIRLLGDPVPRDRQRRPAHDVVEGVGELCRAGHA